MEKQGKLEKGAVVNHFCKGCKSTQEMRYEGLAVPDSYTNPRFTKYRNQHMYTCMKCGSSFSYKEKHDNQNS